MLEMERRIVPLEKNRTDLSLLGHRSVVVLPTYNERENIALLVSEVRMQLPGATIWIVDDNSPDGTGRIADDLARTDMQIQVTHRPGKLGLGTAYLEAFKRAVKQDIDYVLTMDTDFSHDPKYLPALMAAASHADLVIGSRYIAGGGTLNWPLKRRILSRVANTAARVGLGIKSHDTTGAFRLYRTSALQCIDFDALQVRGYGFLMEVLSQIERRGMRVREEPIIFVERTAGASKMSRAIAQEALVHIVKGRMSLLLGRSLAIESASISSPMITQAA